RKQCRLPDARESDESDIREHFQLERNAPFLAGLPFFCNFRRRIARRYESTVSAASSTTLCNDRTLTVLDEIGNDITRFCIFHDRSWGNRNDEIVTIFPVLFLSF